MKHPSINHYKYLTRVLPAFFAQLGVRWEDNAGIVLAHGDTCYAHRARWDEAGLPFEKGVAIYLLTYVRPFGQECRETPTGWVRPDQWVLDNKNRFLPFLPDATTEDESSW